MIADSCNPIELTRREWERVALDAGVPSTLNVEVVCSDVRQHRSRVESRLSDVPGLKLPSWSDVTSREDHQWTTDRLVIDTAGQSSQESQAELLRRVRELQVSKGKQGPARGRLALRAGADSCVPQEMR